MSDQEAPDDFDPTTDRTALRYQERANALRLAQRTGRNRYIPKLTRQVQRLGAQLGENQSDVALMDFESPDFDMSRASGLRGVFNRMDRNAGRGGARIRPGVFGTQLSQVSAENRSREGERIFDEQIDPALEQGQGIASELASTPVFGAEDIANARSRIGAAIRGTQEQATKRNMSIFGLSGALGAASPAATAIAERTSMEADAELARALTDFDFESKQANRSGMESGATLLSRLSLARQSARQAATSGDTERLFEIQEGISGLLEAIRAQRELEEFQRAQARDAGNQESKMGYIRAGASLLGSAMSAAATAYGGGGSPGGYQAGSYLSSQAGQNPYSGYSPYNG